MSSYNLQQQDQVYIYNPITLIIHHHTMRNRQKNQRSQTIEKKNNKNIIKDIQVYRTTNQIFKTYLKKDKKPMWVYTAFGGSKLFCFMDKGNYINHYLVKHFTVNKNFLGEIFFHAEWCSSCMVTNDKLILLTQSQNQANLIQWDLKTYQKIKISLNSQYSKLSQSLPMHDKKFQIFGFVETGILAVCGPVDVSQSNLMQKGIAYVQYYKTPLKPNDEPMWKLERYVKGQSLQFRKLNHHSMVALIPKRYDKRNQIQFTCFHINSKLKGDVIDFSFKNNYLPNQSTNCIYDVDIWQMSKERFYLKFEELCNLQHIEFKNQKISSFSYIWDFANQVVRSLYTGYQKIPHNVQFVNAFRPKRKPLILTNRHGQGFSVYLSRQTLYIDPKKQSIISIQKSKQYQLENAQSLISILPEYNPKISITAYSKFQQCFISIKRLLFAQYDHKTIITFILNEMIQNCDYDLIYYVIQLTSLSKEFVWIKSE